MSFLARFSLKNRGLIALIAIVVSGFGLFAIPSLKQQLLPSLEFPAAFVMAPYQGASPDIVERQVTVPIENAVKGINGVEGISSTSAEGAATVQVEFAFGTDLTTATNQMQTALGRISSQLPDGVDPTVFAGSTADLPAIVLAAAAGDGDQRALATRLERSVVPEIQDIDGVRTVEITGTTERNVVITPNPAKLAAEKVQPTAIGQALQANGVSVPAGTVTDDDKALTVQVGTPLSGLDDLRKLPVAASDGTMVPLSTIAAVSQVDAPATSLTRTDGAPSLGIAITATPDGNAVSISHAVNEKLAELGEAANATLTVVFDQAPFVEKSIESLTTEGALGLVMAVVVILVFLLSVRSTVVTAVSIPLSVLVALIVLWMSDYSLNLLTLGALTIAIGRVVDDSIVVLENIKRHLGYGEDKREAILTGVREVAGAVTASTLTTVAVFAPIALVGGFVGQLFAPFAITVTVALLASLLVSLTVIPVLAYWFLKPAASSTEGAAVRAAAEEKERRSPLQRAYLPVIRFATRRRWATLAIGVLVLAGTLGLASRLETNFLDESGQNTLSVSQEMPVGTSLAVTDEAAERVEQVLQDTPEITSYQVTVGGDAAMAMFGGGGANSASYSITLADGHDAVEVGDLLREKFAGLDNVGELKVGSDAGAGGFSANEVQVVVKAADQQTLDAAAGQVREAFAATEGLTDITSSAAESMPRLDVTVDRTAAGRHGLTEQAVAQTVAAAFRGTPLGQLPVDGDQETILLRFGAVPLTIEQVRALPLTTPDGVIKLDDVADASVVDGPVKITRLDGERSVTVSGTASGVSLGAATTALTERLDGLTLPGGATYEIGGASAEQADAFGDLGLAVLAAIAIVFLIMVATFRSLIQPLILLVSIPFAATGAIALLLATGTPLGVPALIGMLMLVGIVVTNAIVLMDLINQYRDQGMSVQEAVIEGGRKRLRPILMTAVATIFALIPMALGLTGEGGFISRPLAIVVIGGLLSSTLLTLVLVPTLYTMVERRKERRRERRANRGRHAAEPAPTPEPEPAVPVS